VPFAETWYPELEMGMICGVLLFDMLRLIVASDSVPLSFLNTCRNPSDAW